MRFPTNGTDIPTSRDGKLHDEKEHIRVNWDTLETQAIYREFSTAPAVWKYSCYGSSSDSGAKVDSMDLFYMPFRIMRYDPDGYDYDTPMLTGLLLGPTGKRKGEYQRLGQFEMAEYWVEKSVRSLVVATEILDEQVYVSKHDEGRYTIRVI